MTTAKKIKVGLADLEKEYGRLTFAKVILAHRLAEQLTQVEMADKLEISKQSLNDLEKGRRIPSVSRATKIAKKLQLLPESFIELALSDQLREQNLKYEVKVISSKKKAA